MTITGSTPLRAVRRLAPQISEEKTHGGARPSLLEVDVVAHPEKRRRLFLSVGVAEPQKSAWEATDKAAEAWESPSTTDPESPAGTPKSSSMSAGVSGAGSDEEGGNVIEEALADIVDREEVLEAEVIGDMCDVICTAEAADTPRAAGDGLESPLARRRTGREAVAAADVALSVGTSETCRRSFETSLEASWHARELVRGAVDAAMAKGRSKASSRTAEVALRAQVFACYFVQASIAAVGDTAELTTERLSVVVSAAAHVALEVAGAFDLFLGSEVVNEATAALGSAIRENLLSAPENLPSDFLQEVADDLAAGLPTCEAFRANFSTKAASEEAARDLVDPVLQVANRFVADGAMSAAVILEMEPDVAAAAAIALAAGVVLRRMGAEVDADDLLELLETETCDTALLRESVTAFSDVFAAWRSLRRRRSAGGGPRAAPLAAARRRLPPLFGTGASPIAAAGGSRPRSC